MRGVSNADYIDLVGHLTLEGDVTDVTEADTDSNSLAYAAEVPSQSDSVVGPSLLPATAAKNSGPDEEDGSKDVKPKPTSKGKPKVVHRTATQSVTGRLLGRPKWHIVLGSA